MIEDKASEHLVDGNHLTLVAEGPDRLNSLIHLIDTAHRRLDLCFYIFAADTAGQLILDALIEARNRDVAVTLLVDAFGSATTPRSFFAPLIEAGGRFGSFGYKPSIRYLIRNHQKMAIADGRRAMVGGFNCENGYFAAAGDPEGWRDFGLLVEGPLVSDLQDWFDGIAAWTLDSRQTFRALRRLVRSWQPGEGSARWLMGGPTRYLNGWARTVKRDLQAGNRLDMIAAYFSPGRGMLRRMERIARKGAAVLVVPERSDNSATIAAARHLYHRMLRAGIAIHEYRPQKLHSKLLVVDDIAFVGSANFDKRSLFLNLELMLRVEDPGFATAIREHIGNRVEESRKIDEEAYARMTSPWRKFIWWLNYLLVGVVDYTVARRLNFRRERR